MGEFWVNKILFIPNNSYSFEICDCFPADDMGLGKTLTMIALVLKSSEMEAEIEENRDSDDSIQNLDLDNSTENSTLNSIH